MIADCPAHNQARICKLARDDIRGDLSRDFGVIGHAVLLAPEQNIARHRTPHRREEVAVFREKRDGYIVFRTETEEKGRTEHIAETHDASYHVYGELEQFLLFEFYNNGFTLFVDIGTL